MPPNVVKFFLSNFLLISERNGLYFLLNPLASTIFSTFIISVNKNSSQLQCIMVRVLKMPIFSCWIMPRRQTIFLTFQGVELSLIWGCEHPQNREGLFLKYKENKWIVLFFINPIYIFNCIYKILVIGRCCEFNYFKNYPPQIMVSTTGVQRGKDCFLKYKNNKRGLL